MMVTIVKRQRLQKGCKVIRMENQYDTHTSPTIVSKAIDWIYYEWVKFAMKLGPCCVDIDTIILLLL